MKLNFLKLYLFLLTSFIFNSFHAVGENQPKTAASKTAESVAETLEETFENTANKLKGWYKNAKSFFSSTPKTSPQTKVSTSAKTLFEGPASPPSGNYFPQSQTNIPLKDKTIILPEKPASPLSQDQDLQKVPLQKRENAALKRKPSVFLHASEDIIRELLQNESQENSTILDRTKVICIKYLTRFMDFKKENLTSQSLSNLVDFFYFDEKTTAMLKAQVSIFEEFQNSAREKQFAFTSRLNEAYKTFKKIFSSACKERELALTLPHEEETVFLIEDKPKSWKDLLENEKEALIQRAISFNFLRHLPRTQAISPFVAPYFSPLQVRHISENWLKEFDFNTYLHEKEPFFVNSPNEAKEPFLPFMRFSAKSVQGMNSNQINILFERYGLYLFSLHKKLADKNSNERSSLKEFDFVSKLSPQEKEKWIKKAQEEQRKILMVKPGEDVILHGISLQKPGSTPWKRLSVEDEKEIFKTIFSSNCFSELSIFFEEDFRSNQKNPTLAQEAKHYKEVKEILNDINMQIRECLTDEQKSNLEKEIKKATALTNAFEKEAKKQNEAQNESLFKRFFK